MNYIKVSLLLLTCFLLSMTATTQDSRQLDPFDELVVSGNLRIQLIPSDTLILEVEADEHKLDIDYERGRLRIKREHLWKIKSYDDAPIDIRLYYQDMREIRASASARVIANESIQADKIKLVFQSAAKGQLKLDVAVVDARVSEGAELLLEGTTRILEGTAGTGGQLEAYDLESGETYVRAHTGGEAEVVANNRLDAQANTGGEISYRGEPEKRYVKDSFGGNVRSF